MAVQPAQIRGLRLFADGRLWVVCALVAYFSSLAVAARMGQLAHFWRDTLGVPTEQPPFLDAWVITTGITCSRRGLDPLVANPCDPDGRTLNYPRIWLFLGQLGIGESETIILGFICGFLFFVLALLLIGRLELWQALIYSVVFCSPPVMLAVERGNNDLVLYILHVGALFLLQNGRLSVRSVGYGLLLFTAVLKYYPIFAFGTAFKERPRVFLTIIGGAAVIFGIYIAIFFHDLTLNSRGTPAMVETSFGSLVLFQKLLQSYPDLTFLSFLHSGGPRAALVKPLLKYSPAIIGLAAFAVFWLRGRPSVAQSMSPQSGLHFDAFRLGACIYIVSFCLGNSFDYRLIFLTFTLPQIMTWARSGSPFALLSRLALGGIVAALLLSSTSYRNLDEVFNWLLVFYLEYMFILTLPNWVWRKPEADALLLEKS